MVPIIQMIACMSLDGRISTADEVPPNQEKHGGWTSAEDKEYFMKAVDSCDVIIMGRKTAYIVPDFKKPTMIISRHDNVINKQTGEIGIVRPKLKELIEVVETISGVGKGRALLIGGAQTYALFLQHGLVDMIRLTVEPVVLQTGPALGFNGLFNAEAAVNKFKLVDMFRMNARGSLHLVYERV